MSGEYTEDPVGGYFNCWSGRYSPAAVRTFDLLREWRDGAKHPPLRDFPNLRALSLPIPMLDEGLLAEVAATRVTSLTLELGEGELPDGIFRLGALEDLDISGNRLSTLPDLFASLPHLRSLDIRHNALQELPPSLLHSRTLATLDASFNGLREVPMFDRSAPLTTLSLAANPITILEVKNLPAGMTDLDINAELTAIPSELATLVELRRLAIANPVTAIPDLRGLSKLVDIQLAGTLGAAIFDQLPTTIEVIRGYGSHRIALDRIPPQIARFSRLRELLLNFEPLKELPSALRELRIERLELSSTLLADTPTYAHLPATLRELHLANVGMTRVPGRLCELVELRKLVLAANRLATVPESLRRLPHLAVLDLV